MSDWEWAKIGMALMGWLFGFYQMLVNIRANQKAQMTQISATREDSRKSKNQAWVRESYIVECTDPLLDWLHQEILITGLWWQVVQHQNPNESLNRHVNEAFAQFLRKSGFAIPHAPPIDPKGRYVGSFGGKEPEDFGINPIPRAAVTRLNRLAM